MTVLTKTWRGRHRLALAALLSAAFAALAFACGSNDDVPPSCEGAACIDGGGAESSTPEGSKTDGPNVDAPTDATNDSSDAGACKLEAADADAGPSGSVQWALNFGVSGGMSPAAVALAPSTGDVVAVGGLQGSVDFGGGVMTGTPGYDTFVARFDSSGGYKWAKTFGNGLTVGANSVAVDSSGNVAVGGLFEGTVDFGGGPLTAVGDFDAFLVEFDAAGAHRWSKSFGVAGQTENLNAVRVDSTGNVLIGGVARGGVNLGGSALSGFYIAKFSPTGTHVWSKAFAAASTTSSPQITVDAVGNVLLAGSFSGTANFGGATLTSGVSADAFLAKYDSSGAHQWAKQFSATDAPDGVPQAAAFGVAADGCGNVLMSGSFYGKLNFGVGVMAAAPDVGNLFLTKLDALGNGLWSRQFAGSQVDQPRARAVAVTGTGGPVMELGLLGSANFGGGVLTSVGQTSTTLGAFSPAGAFRWAHTGGSPSTATASGGGGPHAIAASSTRIVVVGKFTGAGKTLAFAGKTLTAVTLSDMFLISLAP